MRGYTLEPEVYDALKASVEQNGGVGAGKFWEYMDGSVEPIPCCIHGHASAILPRVRRPQLPFISENDTAVMKINRDKGSRVANDIQHTRVTWDEYCAELNITRGPDDTVV